MRDVRYDMRSIVLNGYGIHVGVRDGVLVLEHGDPGERERLEIGRSQRSIRHVIVAGRTGYVSLAALRWCDATGMTVTVLDDRGAPRMVTMAGDWLNGALRRRQSLADGVAIGRRLIARKLEEQIVTLELLPEQRSRNRAWARAPQAGKTGPEQLRAYLENVRAATTLAELNRWEAVAGKAYWWRVARAQMVWKETVPEHWHYMGQRRIKWSEAIRNDGYAAITPGMALINYGYGYLLAEAVQACYAVGLDPAIGYLHRLAKVDREGAQRAEFAMDLMEPARPVVDRQVLELIGSRSFSKRDALEAPNGGIALSQKLRRELISRLTPLLISLLDKEAVSVARLVRRSS